MIGGGESPAIANDLALLTQGARDDMGLAAPRGGECAWLLGASRHHHLGVCMNKQQPRRLGTWAPYLAGERPEKILNRIAAKIP